MRLHSAPRIIAKFYVVASAAFPVDTPDNFVKRVQSIGNVGPTGPILFPCECVFVPAGTKPKGRSLHSVRVLNIELLTYNCPGCVRFVPRHLERTWIVPESLALQGYHLWQQSAQNVIPALNAVPWAIKENVTLRWVSVEVQEYFVAHLSTNLSHLLYLRKCRRIMKLSVEVSTHDGSSEITQYNSIHIEHGHNSDYIVFPQKVALRGDDMWDETIHHPAALGFSRVLPAYAKDVLLWALGGKVRDPQHWDFQTSCRVQVTHFHHVGSFLLELFNSVQ